MIESISKTRGSAWMANNDSKTEIKDPPSGTDHYSASHIHLLCKDFTYYWFDFVNDDVCCDTFAFLSERINLEGLQFYAYDYQSNALEEKLDEKGWNLYDDRAEYQRQGLESDYWRATEINHDYKFCPSYPKTLIVPSSVSDNVVHHAGKFRSKQRIPSVVYRHRGNSNHNVIARCSQPLVGINLQNRSLQDEKLISEIFKTQDRERNNALDTDNGLRDQPQRNLIVDLRPISNAMAQHALGAGTENIDKYRESLARSENDTKTTLRPLDKIFGNIDNIHVIRDSLTKLTAVLRDLDKRSAVGPDLTKTAQLQLQLTKTLWLNRIAIILQSVDRITKSIHLNNTNVVIHCSDGWDRTSQVSSLLQLCLDPYFRTIKGFMILIEKEWVSFGYKFRIRADHGHSIGSITPASDDKNAFSLNNGDAGSGTQARVASFLQKAAYHIKTSAAAAASAATTASSASNSTSDLKQPADPMINTYSGSSERSPVFHQFLDCVYQILRQCPTAFEFNSRFLKRLFYHHYSCQYGTFLANTEQEYSRSRGMTVSAWDYFRSRPNEFINPQYVADGPEVITLNYSDVKWWAELYGRSDEEMNGLSNSLDRKFRQMKLQK